MCSKSQLIDIIFCSLNDPLDSILSIKAINVSGMLIGY